MRISGIKVLGVALKILSIIFLLDHMPFSGTAGPLRAAVSGPQVALIGLLNQIFPFRTSGLGDDISVSRVCS